MRFPVLAMVMAQALVLLSCEQTTRVGEIQTARDVEGAQKRLLPTVRAVPDANVDLLWKSAEGFMERTFKEGNLDVRDALRHVVETHTLEYGDERLPRRTRVTVEVRRTPGRESEAQVGVVALDIVKDVTSLTADTPGLPDRWILAGQLPEVEELVADQIVRRYLLLLQGRDPETVPQGELPAGLRPKSG